MKKTRQILSLTLCCIMSAPLSLMTCTDAGQCQSAQDKIEAAQIHLPADTEYFSSPVSNVMSALELFANRKDWLNMSEPRDKKYASLTNNAERISQAEEYYDSYNESFREKTANDFILNQLAWTQNFWQSRYSQPRDTIFKQYKPTTLAEQKDLQNFVLTSLIDNLEFQCRYYDESPTFAAGKRTFTNSLRHAHYLTARANQKVLIKLKKENAYGGPLPENKIKESLAQVANQASSKPDLSE